MEVSFNLNSNEGFPIVLVQLCLLLLCFLGCKVWLVRFFPQSFKVNFVLLCLCLFVRLLFYSLRPAKATNLVRSTQKKSMLVPFGTLHQDFHLPKCTLLSQRLMFLQSSQMRLSSADQRGT